MKEEFFKVVLKQGFSTVLACLFCYFLFFIMESHQQKTEEIRENEVELFKAALKNHRDANTKMLRELIDCLKE